MMICPVLAMGKTDSNSEECKKGSCAWYITSALGSGACAVNLLARVEITKMEAQNEAVSSEQV